LQASSAYPNAPRRAIGRQAITHLCGKEDRVTPLGIKHGSERLDPLEQK